MPAAFMPVQVSYRCIAAEPGGVGEINNADAAPVLDRRITAVG
ncbi:hypothetical protein ES703_96518 [subsurface metagenome]